MSIPVGLYDHPVVRTCIEEAYRRIDGWTVTQHLACIEAKELLTSGWDGVALAEIVAEALLEARGIGADDLALFEELFSFGCVLEQRARGAAFERWDMERAKRRAEAGRR